MAYDLSVLDKLKQRFRYHGTSLFVETYNKDTNVVVDSFEFTNAKRPGAPVPEEVSIIARNRMAWLLEASVRGALYPQGSQTVVAIGNSLLANATSFVTGIPHFDQTQGSSLNMACRFLRQAMHMPWGGSAGASTPDIVNYNLAVSGCTSADVILSQIGPAAALKAGLWDVNAFTNDFTLLPSDSLIQIINRALVIYDAGVQAGAKVIFETVPPRNDANWQTYSAAIIAAGSTVAAQRAKHMGFNQWLRRMAQEKAPGFILADHYNELVDPASATGDWLSGYTSDGIHWALPACWVAGRVLANAVAPYMRPALQSGISLVDAFDAVNNPGGNLALNFNLAGGNGATAPTGWTVDQDGGTSTTTVATAARTDALAPGIPSNGRELTLTTSTATAGRYRAYQTQMSTLVPAGVPYYGEAEIEIMANTAAWGGPALHLFDSNTTTHSRCGELGLGNVPLGATGVMVLRTPIVKAAVPSGRFLFTQMMTTAASAGVWKIKRVGIYPLSPVFPGGLVLGAS